MCHHLNALGQFQSDQYPNMRPDEIVLSFRDPAAIEALHVFADLTDDDDFFVNYAIPSTSQWPARPTPARAGNRGSFDGELGLVMVSIG